MIPVSHTGMGSSPEEYYEHQRETGQRERERASNIGNYSVTGAWRWPATGAIAPIGTRAIARVAHTIHTLRLPTWCYCRSAPHGRSGNFPVISCAHILRGCRDAIKRMDAVKHVPTGSSRP